ncbi:hypothetical protein Tco_0841279 [Tanacetum coccineum]|uniref:Uncharacterized protein n=1 Tax=Tanacetum coccineum TaxID=301880 RepID=A0ABQ5AYM8_9ASTR
MTGHSLILNKARWFTYFIIFPILACIFSFLPLPLLFTAFLRLPPAIICYLKCVFFCPSFVFCFAYPSFESLAMSLEESDDLVLPDAAPAGPALEAGSLPKFDMHVHTSSLTETQVKWLARCYGIPEELHPRVVPEGMTMNALPNDALGLYVHHFEQGGLGFPFPPFS